MSIWVVLKDVWRAKQHLNWFQILKNVLTLTFLTEPILKVYSPKMEFPNNLLGKLIVLAQIQKPQEKLVPMNV